MLENIYKDCRIEILVTLRIDVSTHLSSNEPIIAKSTHLIGFCVWPIHKKGDLRLSGPPSGWGAGGSVGTHNRPSLKISGRTHYYCATNVPTHFIERKKRFLYKVGNHRH
ncbi:hypothetical protein PoB_007546900 [Plakobranchus ocellatus]|uniref:Uncharacterized protein n=1 Tax=Plakobranchus ocellatus TaxID=259542 RepID=A0AAV4DY23_9GAST|nr:hypothetical protein PoB_007546900 [Plakobranchus ocellatus]